MADNKIDQLQNLIFLVDQFEDSAFLIKTRINNLDRIA